MKAFIISDVFNKDSLLGVQQVILSANGSDLDFHILQATTPNTLDYYLTELFDNLEWTYPEKEPILNQDLKLLLSPYKANDISKVFACTLSHARLWKMCSELNEPIMILEHDALFTNKFNWNKLKDKFTGGVLGLNNPRGATRRASVFHAKVLDGASNTKGRAVITCPWIDDKTIPQGIAGNSAYIIKPHAARALLDKLMELGGWPNDALMCNQLFPWLQVVYPYYTTVQGIKSTTTS